MAGGFALAISLCFHKHAPQQRPTYLTLEQQVANQLWCHLLGGADEEELREVLGELGGYGSGYG